MVLCPILGASLRVSPGLGLRRCRSREPLIRLTATCTEASGSRGLTRKSYQPRRVRDVQCQRCNGHGIALPRHASILVCCLALSDVLNRAVLRCADSTAYGR
jgi:hypothetical protein